MAKEKICTVCGKRYEYCGNCHGAKSTETWRNVFCSEECRDIFNVCARYVGKDITKEEAYNMLMRDNVSTKQIGVAVKETVDEIVDTSPTQKLVVETVSEPIVEEISVTDDSIIEEVSEAKAEDIVTEKETPVERDAATYEESNIFKRSHRRRNNRGE